ncbi:putative carboxylesterase 3 [Apostasia shenzhenica]|uniref:Putative carboxylesterase 3 n=1 Tax=Apostasia shenzhenica TaxID=1088818 RepID=A0A2I0AIH9_9ASPA|nr:putative carboxylesterase 3 [Apostasia shenzhenica]
MGRASSTVAAVAPAMTAGSDDSVLVEIPMFVRIYRSGRIERLHGQDFVPAAVDSATGVSSKDVTFNSVHGLSTRLYLPPISAVSARKKLPVVVYYHGGAFCTGSPFSSVYHNYLNSLVDNAGVLAVSVEYRLAPEHPLPAAFEDSWEALRWVMTSADREPWLAEYGDLSRVFLAGDSCGGNIAHQMGMKLGELGKKVEGLAIVQPFFWGKERIGREKIVEAGDHKVMPMAIDELILRLLLPGTQKGLDDPWINPTAAGAASMAGLGCRRLLLCVAEMDLGRDRGVLYYEKLVSSGWGGEAEILESKGARHGFQLHRCRSDQVAGQLMQRMVRFFAAKTKKGDSLPRQHSWGKRTVSDEKARATNLRAKL